MSTTATTLITPAEREGGRQRPKSGWLAISGLLLLSALPVIGGVLRLTTVGADTEREIPLASLVAIIAHIVAMTVFCLVGAFQFSPALRLRRGWHRAAGRVLIPAGIIAALASIWLAVFFSGPPEEFALAMVRLVFAVPMTGFLVIVIAIRRRDFVAHGAWMTRAYAIAVSGGTQALVSILGTALMSTLWTLNNGEVDAYGEAWFVATGFVINSVVAELLIRRRAGRRIRGRLGRGALES
ncbi:DUF2306 domain-containing protein [Salinibacterium sp. TMP30]|uniref:DUF2306 domain-containing protein n=1 Tax=Salinibacterium sp. TMP30 TaxID=3138237 RepID=UPI00313947DC